MRALKAHSYMWGLFRHCILQRSKILQCKLRIVERRAAIGPSIEPKCRPGEAVELGCSRLSAVLLP